MTEREPVDYESLAESFDQALIHTLRNHTVADSFLDYWVPDKEPVLGISGMADSARIAGLTEIAIKFRSTTIPEARLAELENAVALFSDVTFEKLGDNVIMRATGMSISDDSSETRGAVHDDAKPVYWRAEMAIADTLDGSVPEWLGTGNNAEFADVHPHFRAGLKAQLDRLAREGQSDNASDGLVRVKGQEGDLILTLDVDPKNHTVRCAHHMGAEKPSERTVLDLFCLAAENIPVQEVADHVGLSVLESLVDEDQPYPVEGVLMPVNAGAPFMLPPRLARQAYDAYRATTKEDFGTNFYYAPPGEAWQTIKSKERTEKILFGLKAFLQSADLFPDDMEFLRLENNKYDFEVRVVIGFSDKVKLGDKPHYLRQLENSLRRRLGVEIELIADRAKDSSKLRRLG